MAIGALGYAVARIKEYSSDIFVGVGSFDTPDTLYSLGAVRNIVVQGTPRETPADSHQRTYQRGLDIEASWEVMQTDYSVEFVELPDLIDTANMLKVTDDIVTGADESALSTAAHAADGMEFANPKLKLGFTYNGDGGANFFNMSFSGRLSIAQIKQIGNSPVILGG